jgi:hypothetical protein
MKKLTLTENKLRQIVRESIMSIINEGIDRSIYDITFISYGTDNFSVEDFKQPYFDEGDVNKPRGGFWGSPIDSVNGWGKWCDDNEFYINKLDKHVLFKVKKDARIYVIDTKEDLDRVSTMSDYSKEKLNNILNEVWKFNPHLDKNNKKIYDYVVNDIKTKYSHLFRKVLNFKFLYDNYDGVFATSNAVSKLRHVSDGDGLYWWDVESICIFRPEAIEIISETAFDKAKVPSYEGDKDGYWNNDTKDIKKEKQINKTYELYGNQNIKSDSSELFNGEHPGILAQGHGNNKKTKLARKYNGTIKSGI